jgi:hypothetical protein
MRTIIQTATVLALAVGASGCKEYFTVDEACHPDGKFRGMDIDTLQPGEAAAIDRMNCYRRLVGFERFGVHDALQQAAENMGGYVAQNPDVYGRTGSALSYLVQEGARPGFTGTEIWERLDVTNYPIPDATAIRVEQGIGVIPYEVSGAEVVDEILMRTHWGQEGVITPSPYDVAYTEATLDAAWWLGTGLTQEQLGQALPDKGTIIYYVVASQSPPTEGAGETPIILPKRNQEGVPLTGPLTFDRYQPDINSDGVVDLNDATQLSYPITLGYTSAQNPTGSSGVTPFDLVITSATIDGPNGPLETVWVSPGEAEPANTRLDALSGTFNYWAGGIYATEAFTPNTAYRLYVDITTVDGPSSHNLTFTTASSDSVGGANTAATTSRSRWGAEAPRLDSRWLGHRIDVR